MTRRPSFRRTLRFSLLPVAAALFAALWIAAQGPSQSALQAADPEPQPQPGSSASTPVEPDMHEFMEYAFQPVYLRLKQSLAEAPADRAAWKAVKSDSLILAEGGNLLLDRLPEEKAEDWTRFSVEVRDRGGDLYRAAKKSDYETSRKTYEAMLVSCNACHTAFADGEHQLKP